MVAGSKLAAAAAVVRALVLLLRFAKTRSTIYDLRTTIEQQKGAQQKIPRKALQLLIETLHHYITFTFFTFASHHRQARYVALVLTPHRAESPV